MSMSKLGTRPYDEFMVDSDGNRHFYSQKYAHLNGTAHNAFGGLEDEDETRGWEVFSHRRLARVVKETASVDVKPVCISFLICY